VSPNYFKRKRTKGILNAQPYVFSSFCIRTSHQTWFGTQIVRFSLATSPPGYFEGSKVFIKVRIILVSNSFLARNISNLNWN